MNKKYQNILKKFFHSETTNDYTLEKITQACAFFGNPQDTFRSIHIAGTNGKGSTSKMIFQMLKESGKWVWVYTSPHNIDIRERFEVANCFPEKAGSQSSKWLKRNPHNPLFQGGISWDWLISEDAFVGYVEQIITYGWRLSYYERCVLMAFLYFRDRGCEYAVIEVGMWGRLDATNIITPILSIITSISYDHMEFLGYTLEAIAWEKWGIIKPWIPVILYGTNSTLESIAHERNAHTIFSKSRSIETNLLGEHQISNARIAYEAGIFLGIEEAIIEHALLHVDHHGRLEYLKPNLLIDGAHNEDGLRKLKEYLNREQRKWDEIILAFNLKEGKSASLVLDIFDSVNNWIVVDSHGFRVSDAQMIAGQILEWGKYVRILSPDVIFDQARIFPRTLFVVFGSLYMMKEFLWKYYAQ